MVQVRDVLSTKLCTDVWLRTGAFVGRHESCAVALNHPDAPLVAACVVRRGRYLFLEGQGPKSEVGRERSKRHRLYPEVRWACEVRLARLGVWRRRHGSLISL